MLTNVKIRKTKILGLEELKMLFRVKEERIYIFIKVKERKSNIKCYFYLTQQYACFK